MMEVKVKYDMRCLTGQPEFTDSYKDGLPMICIILRNIDTESTDYELLLFGYLKVF